MNREVIIAGRIDSDSAAAFAQRLQGLTEADVLTVRIDSHGGDTVAGLAMHDLLKTLPCRTEAVVLGLCASAATFVACGCQSIAMLPSATWMIHYPAGGLYGTVQEIEAQLEHFRNLENTVVSIYAAHTGRSEEEIREELRTEKFYNAATALSKGWVTSIVGGAAAAETEQEQPTAMVASYERSFKLWDSIPAMVAAGIDLFRSPEERAERKATEQLAGMEAELQALRSECKAATDAAASTREELARMAAEREGYAQRVAAETIARLGLDSKPLPEPASELQMASAAERIRQAAASGGIEAALAAYREQI
ncbi:MAG: Clp protease ClpP [Akkermansia sp.]|nr:Clp protease ClpP [Akkermansia sp.]